MSGVQFQRAFEAALRLEQTPPDRERDTKQILRDRIGRGERGRTFGVHFSLGNATGLQQHLGKNASRPAVRGSERHRAAQHVNRFRRLALRGQGNAQLRHGLRIVRTVTEIGPIVTDGEVGPVLAEKQGVGKFRMGFDVFRLLDRRRRLWPFVDPVHVD